MRIVVVESDSRPEQRAAMRPLVLAIVTVATVAAKITTAQSSSLPISSSLSFPYFPLLLVPFPFSLPLSLPIAIPLSFSLPFPLSFAFSLPLPSPWDARLDPDKCAVRTGLAFGCTGLCSCRVRGVDGSCAKHLTVESYMVIYAPNSYTYYY